MEATLRGNVAPRWPAFARPANTTLPFFFPRVECENEKEVAAYIKAAFEKEYGCIWHCFVGRNFGAYVTHDDGRAPVHMILPNTLFHNVTHGTAAQLWNRILITAYCLTIP